MRNGQFSDNQKGLGQFYLWAVDFNTAHILRFDLISNYKLAVDTTEGTYLRDREQDLLWYNIEYILTE